jgi:lactate dehydrogenase-like 2-hydroxyacid dehydrogenase
MATAKNLKLCITAGVGSDHIDLDAANEKNITVIEVTGSNVVSVAEHVVMSILLLVRNYTPGKSAARVDDIMLMDFRQPTNNLWLADGTSLRWLDTLSISR